MQELDQRKQRCDSEQSNLRQEIDAQLRREWEVKAKLEIDRLVQLEIGKLQKKFDEEVSGRGPTRNEEEVDHSRFEGCAKGTNSSYC